MIHLKLIRVNPKNIEQKFTHGELFTKANSGKWLDFCYTLEDTVRDLNKDGDLEDEDEGKIYAETAIPFGEYDGQITLSPAFKRDLPLLFNVKHFSGIRIHSGNTAEHSKGCILVGYSTDDNGKIWNSKNAEQDLVKLILQNDKEGKFTIEII